MKTGPVTNLEAEGLERQAVEGYVLGASLGCGGGGA